MEAIHPEKSFYTGIVSSVLIAMYSMFFLVLTALYSSMRRPRNVSYLLKTLILKTY